MITDGKVDRAKAASQFRRWFSTFQRTYFPREKHPTPKFLIRAHATRMGWYTPSNKTIYINPNALMDIEIFRSISYHEMIHYFEHMVDGLATFTKRYKAVTDGGHGTFFKDKMKEINSIEGKDFIKVRQDSRGLKTAKPFYLFFSKHRSNSYITFWSKKSLKQVPELKDKLLVYNVHSLDGVWYAIECTKLRLQVGVALTKGAKRLSAGIISAQYKEEYELIQRHTKKQFSIV